MYPLPFSALAGWADREYNSQGSVFGIRKEKFYRPAADAARTEIFGAKISSPLGPAAGPHSQLAQNILAAYLAGARFIELKTVQEMDGEQLRKAISRPCINARDEGYNVEWSTELTVVQAMEEYIKAWFLLHLYSKEFGISDNCDFVFNMSAGYSLEGIKSEKIDSFIEGLKDGRKTEIWKQCYKHIAANIRSYKNFTKKDLDNIFPVVCSSITLSTLHGCPREEIEKIAEYLITEKKLHTFIKCNPTLLGYETARELLNKMGYTHISFDDHHFNNDLQFDDAAAMMRRLKKTAAEQNLTFGVKLTNTFPVQIKQNELPGEEMYMSGRALFPLSITAAAKLSKAFNGELPVSFSGGADFFNLEQILKTGIRPVTAATTILKSGGYERLCQLAELAERTLAGMDGGINVKALDALAEALPQMKRYRKEYHQNGTASYTPRPIPLFDCFTAPCMAGSATDQGCPINQNVPEYLAAVAGGDYEKAFRIIAADNTAPTITGTICDHQCQHSCTRNSCDDPLQIRRAKLMAAANAQEAFISSIDPPAVKTRKSTGIIGAGPAGIAAAVFLRRNGVPVTVYERRPGPYGIVQYAIPSFRISEEAIMKDYRIAEKLGVEFIFNALENFSIEELKNKHDFIILAFGAWKEGASPVKQGQENIIGALRFLEDSKKTEYNLELGKNVAVIGGGDVAMDCARAAKRNKGVQAVTIVYRRTREFMPAQHAEQELALDDGVEIIELLSPESYENGILRCEVMRLGEFDAKGRRGVEKTGGKRELRFDTVIGAVGARVDSGIFTANNVQLDDRSRPITGANRESSLPGVYAAGDCRKGAATVVKAIADGKAAAADILCKLGIEADFSTEAAPAPANADFDMLYLKKGILMEAMPDNTDGYRCLKCDALCEICADVCPNRANVSVMAGGSRQIVHIDRLCNECGNCATFCPYAGKPYREKFTVFMNEECFNDSENPGFLKTGRGFYKLRMEDKSIVDCRMEENIIPAQWISIITALEGKYDYLNK